MTFVIMTGGIDLSVGSVVALGGVVAIKVSEHGLAARAARRHRRRRGGRALNGLLITRLRLQPVHRHAGHPARRPRARSQPGRHPGRGGRARRLPELGSLVRCSACRSRRGRCSSPSSSARPCCDYTAWGRRVLAIGGNVDAAQAHGPAGRPHHVQRLRALRRAGRVRRGLPRLAERLGRHGGRAGLGAVAPSPLSSSAARSSPAASGRCCRPWSACCCCSSSST